MTEWIDVVAASALADGEHVVVDVDGDDVAVFNIGGEFYAIADVCTHDAPRSPAASWTRRDRLPTPRCPVLRKDRPGQMRASVRGCRHVSGSGRGWQASGGRPDLKPIRTKGRNYTNI